MPTEDNSQEFVRETQEEYGQALKGTQEVEVEFVKVEGVNGISKITRVQYEEALKTINDYDAALKNIERLKESVKSLNDSVTLIMGALLVVFVILAFHMMTGH